jgi:hypothetical protein
MIRRIDSERLENVLMAFFEPSAYQAGSGWFVRLLAPLLTRRDQRDAK